MAENQDGQEKTEEPSSRKLSKAKEDGKVLTSKEMLFSQVLPHFTFYIFTKFLW